MLSSVDNNGPDGGMPSAEASQGLDKPSEMVVTWLGVLFIYWAHLDPQHTLLAKYLDQTFCYYYHGRMVRQ